MTTYDPNHHASEIAATRATTWLAQARAHGCCMACVRLGLWQVVAERRTPEEHGWWWVLARMDAAHRCGVKA